MKIKGYGQARILNPAQINRLFNELNKSPKYSALYAICFFTGCRISEALQLETSDIVDGYIIFRKAITKGKLKTREIKIIPQLKRYLDNYQPKKPGALFPGQVGRNKYMSRNTADRILRSTCKKLGIEGVSTHSFRRTALTHMSQNGVPLRTIQEISGHTSLTTLQKYLEVTPEEVEKALLTLSI